MKFIYSIICLLLFIPGLCQPRLVYKRNPSSGKLEVYESSISGLPTGEPLYEISKNSWGYLEVKTLQGNEQLQKTVDPYSRKPNYEVMHRQPYNLPYQAAIDQLNTLNRRFAENLNMEGQIKDESARNFIEEIGKKEDEDARNLLLMYQSFTSFPSIIKTGWHKAYNIFSPNYPKESKNLAIAKYIVYVENNKITKCFFIADKESKNIIAAIEPIEVSGTIANSKVILKLESATGYETFYFIDELIDPSYELSINPGFLSITKESIQNDLVGCIFDTPSNPNMYSLKSDDDFFMSHINHNGTLILWNKRLSIDLLFINTGKTYSLLLWDSKSKSTWHLNDISILPGQYINRGIRMGTTQ